MRDSLRTYERRISHDSANGRSPCDKATIPLGESLCGEGVRAVRQLAIKDDGIPTGVAVNAALSRRSIPRHDLLKSTLLTKTGATRI